MPFHRESTVAVAPSKSGAAHSQKTSKSEATWEGLGGMTRVRVRVGWREGDYE